MSQILNPKKWFIVHLKFKFNWSSYILLTILILLVTVLRDYFSENSTTVRSSRKENSVILKVTGFSWGMRRKVKENCFPWWAKQQSNQAKVNLLVSWKEQKKCRPKQIPLHVVSQILSRVVKTWARLFSTLFRKEGFQPCEATRSVWSTKTAPY